MACTPTFAASDARAAARGPSAHGRATDDAACARLSSAAIAAAVADSAIRFRQRCFEPPGPPARGTRPLRGRTRADRPRAPHECRSGKPSHFWDRGLPAACGLDRGDVDLLHRHHGREGALCLIASGGKGVRERTRGDLPGQAPAVLAPAALTFLARHCRRSRSSSGRSLLDCPWRFETRTPRCA